MAFAAAWLDRILVAEQEAMIGLLSSNAQAVILAGHDIRLGEATQVNCPELCHA